MKTISILALALCLAGCSSGNGGGLPQAVGPISVRGEGAIQVDSDLDGRPVAIRALVQGDRSATEEEQEAGAAWVGRISVRYGALSLVCSRATGAEAECDVALDLAPVRPTTGDPGSSSGSP